MVRIRARVALKYRSDHELVIRSNPTRRILFALIAIVLLAAFLVGADWENDFGRERIAANILFFVLTGGAALIAGWSSSVTVDAGSARQIRSAGTLFGLPIRVQTMSADDVRAVTLQGVRLLRESESPRAGLGRSRYAEFVARRTTYYKLFLDTAEDRHLVEDSTDLAELQTIGEAISRVLGVEYRREDV